LQYTNNIQIVEDIILTSAALVAATKREEMNRSFILDDRIEFGDRATIIEIMR